MNLRTPPEQLSPWLLHHMRVDLPELVKPRSELPEVLQKELCNTVSQSSLSVIHAPIVIVYVEPSTLNPIEPLKEPSV